MILIHGDEWSVNMDLKDELIVVMMDHSKIDVDVNFEWPKNRNCILHCIKGNLQKYKDQEDVHKLDKYPVYPYQNVEDCASLLINQLYVNKIPLNLITVIGKFTALFRPPNVTIIPNIPFKKCVVPPFKYPINENTPELCKDYSFLDWPPNILNGIVQEDWSIQKAYDTAWRMHEFKEIYGHYPSDYTVKKKSIFKGISSLNKLGTNLFYRDSSIKETSDGEYIGETYIKPGYYVFSIDDPSTIKTFQNKNIWKNHLTGKYHIPIVQAHLELPHSIVYKEIQEKECKNGYYITFEQPYVRWEKYSDKEDLPNIDIIDIVEDKNDLEYT